LKIYSQRIKLSKDGLNYVGVCPFHSEKTGSFKINQKDGKWLYHCFGCSASGSIIDFVMKFDQVDFGFAIKLIEKELNNTWQNQKELVESSFQPLHKTDEKKLVIPLEKYYPLEQALANSKEAKDWLLKERGITYDAARKSHLGYRRDLGAIATGNNSDISGRGWIAIPFIKDNVVTGIKYRSLVRKVFLHQPGMSTGIFNLEDIDPLETVFVVEGEFDGVVLAQAGFRAISLPSAQYKLTPEQKDKLLEANQIILAGDTDQPGLEAMTRLWNELQERTFLLQWPGFKDANETFLQMCGGNIPAFKKVVDELVQQAKSTPMPNIYSLQESMASANRTNLSEHPQRLRFPWPTVDKMAILLPGSVMSISATNTKMGKTAFIMNVTMDDAIRNDDVILNYQCELSVDEYANMVAAYLLKKNRNNLNKEDYKEAAKRMGNVKYYIGRNPTLNTVAPVLDLIEAGIRRLSPTVVVLDHLHFICRNESNEIQAQANAFQRIKNMAVRYGVKFVVVGQPRKANQASKGKMIHIADLKGSETFGSDADAIFVIHRDNIRVKDPQNPPKDDYDPKTEVHLLGARAKGDGGTFAVLTFIGEWASFHESTFLTPPEESVL
jgi:CHC2 zinc finger/DnaB-like helicase C terminal domain/Toprim-like